MSGGSKLSGVICFQNRRWWFWTQTPAQSPARFSLWPEPPVLPVRRADRRPNRAAGGQGEGTAWCAQHREEARFSRGSAHRKQLAEGLRGPAPIQASDLEPPETSGLSDQRDPRKGRPPEKPPEHPLLLALPH